MSWVQVLLLADAQLGPCHVALDLCSGPSSGNTGSPFVEGNAPNLSHNNVRGPDAITTLILVPRRKTHRSAVLQPPQPLARQVRIWLPPDVAQVHEGHRTLCSEARREV